MTPSKDRLEILERLERGEISPDEAAQLLENGSPAPQTPSTPMEVLEQLERGEIDADQAASLLRKGRPRKKRKHIRQVVTHQKPKDPPRIDHLRRLWLVPLAIGILITALSGFWMQSILTDRGLGLLFLCSWIPLALGVLLIIIGWASQFGTWLHVRVHPNKPGAPRRVVISLPLPLGLASWFLRVFGGYFDSLHATAVDEILRALDESGKSGMPLYVEVDNSDGSGEYVEVFIG